MKRLATSIIALLLHLMVAAQCDLPTTVGNDFWVAFIHNNGEAGTTALKLIATSDQPASITVTNPATNWSTSATLTTNAIGVASATVNIPLSEGNNTSPSTVTHYGLHVTSTANISLIAENNRLASGATASILPTAQLGTRYIVQDYPNSASAGSASVGGCAITMLATQDSTVLTMTLPCATQPSTVSPGNTLTVTLQQGETYMLLTPTPSQFAGMEITSNDKPFALFQGNRITAVLNGGNTSGDHIYEQALPVSAWGTDFVAISTYGRSWGDIVRITAADESCVISVDGAVVTTINPYNTYDYHLLSSSKKHIHTSTPAAATLVMPSSTWNGELGDVSSVTLTPMSASVCEATFRVWQTERCNTFYLAIATDPSSVSGMTLDGNNIAGSFTGTGNYRHALVNVTAGAHRLACSNGTFTAYAYGLGNVESYAFPLTRSFAEYLYDTIDIYDTICMGQSYDTMGIYLAPIVTANPCDSLFLRDLTIGGVMTHIRIHLNILQTWASEMYNSIVLGDTIWVGDTPLTQPGNYTVNLTASNGCDSIVTVHLWVATDTLTLYDTVCQGHTYNGNGFNLTNPIRDMILERDTAEYGMAIHYILYLTVLPSTQTDISYTIILGDTLIYSDTFLIAAGEHRFVYTAADGCDSVVVIHISYEDIGLVADKDGVCPGEAVTLTASGTHTFHWSSTPHDNTIDSQQGSNPIVVHPMVTTTYHLLDSEGNIVASVVVGTAPPPTLCIEYNHNDLDFDNPVLIFDDCSEGRHHTTWTFDDGAIFNGAHIRRQFRHPLPDSVNVTMTTCNQYNCCADTTIALPMKIRSVWFPNVFMPDAESNNLFSCFTSLEVASFNLVIFNRWGFELWSTNDINTPWDGRRTDGTPCTQDAYVYRYWITDTKGHFATGIGTVTLIR